MPVEDTAGELALLDVPADPVRLYLRIDRATVETLIGEPLAEG
jgi:hypothetical protein